MQSRALNDDDEKLDCMQFVDGSVVQLIASQAMKDDMQRNEIAARIEAQVSFGIC